MSDRAISDSVMPDSVMPDMITADSVAPDVIASNSEALAARDRPTESIQENIFKPRLAAVPKSVDPNQLLYAEDLLGYYKFALEGRSIGQVLQQWAIDYPVEWIRSAIVEALYQGRYKLVSVEQILQIWQRRGQVKLHFDPEFEQMIRKRLPQNLASKPMPSASAVSALAAEIQANAHLHRPQWPATESTKLNELTQFIQTRRSPTVGVDAVIDHAEATLDRAATAAKQQLAHDSAESGEASSNPTVAPANKGIEQFTPTIDDSELIDRLKSVSQDP